MNAILHVLGSTFRAFLLIQMMISVPSMGVAAALDAALRCRFRDITPLQAFLNPILAWQNLRPFAIAWFLLLAVYTVLSALTSFSDGTLAESLPMWKVFIVTTIACLAYFWFSRDVGEPRKKGNSGGSSAHGTTLTADALGDYIKARVFGQEANIDRITSLVVDRLFAPRDRGPVCTIMLAGPTGTGKTETARLMAEALQLPLFIVRCNEYANQWSIERLIGSQSSYRNSEQGGELVNALRSSPRGVLVLDEIEKADSAVAKVLMTLLDEGYITCAFDGTVVDARGWIMFATTNAAHEAVAELMMSELDAVSLRVAIKDALRDHWSPEILGRLDRVLAFRRVTDHEQVANALVEKAIGSVLSRTPNLDVQMDEHARRHLQQAAQRMGKYGYRELERYVEEVTSMGLGGRQHQRRKTRLLLEYVVAGGELSARLVDKAGARR